MNVDATATPGPFRNVTESFDSQIFKNRGFKMGLLNINGLSGHIDELRIVMSLKPLDILAVNETKLSSSISDELINIIGYQVVKKDRNIAGGGVCFYVRNSINFKLREDLINNNLELIPLEIKKPNSRSFLVATWYRPPKSDVERLYDFEEFIKKAEAVFERQIYIMGDINCNLLAASPEYHTKQLNDLLDIYQLTQIINEPTRVTEKSHTLIDLFITNDKENIVSSGVYPLSISDHYLIYAVRKIGIPRSNPRFIQTRSFKHFSKGNFLSDLKNAKWTNLNEICDVNEAWELWKNTFLSVLNKHAPCRSIRKRNKPAPWINSTIKKQMLLRDLTKKKAQKSDLAREWNEYIAG